MSFLTDLIKWKVPRGLTVTSTELDYVAGATSSIQTQLNTKAPLASPVFTGTATAPIVASTNGFRATEGANAKQGTAVLVAGTVTVANTSVTAVSRIFLTSQVDGGTVGFLRVSARTAGTSFTITSSSATDTSTVAFEIFEPA